MKKSRANSILSAIHTGNIRMRSTWSIGLEKAGTGGLIAATLGVLTFLSGVVMFWFTANRDLLGSQYGWYGAASFVQSFPYISVMLFAACFLTLTVLLRRFDFSYKKPLLGILALILVAITVVSIAINNTPSSQAFIRRGAGYMGMMRGNGSNFILGTVISVQGNTYSVGMDDGSTVEVKVSDSTHYPFGMPKAGDEIRAVGSWNKTVFVAFGIRVFSESRDEIRENGRGMRQGGGMGRGMMRSY